MRRVKAAGVSFIPRIKASRLTEVHKERGTCKFIEELVNS
jgi:hypothetical protein